MTKIVRVALLGPMGIGKSTALRSVCFDRYVECEALNLDTNTHPKLTTTVGAEFGEVDLGGGDTLQLYGSPGQSRFGIVRKAILSVCSGVILMTDAVGKREFSDEIEFLDEISTVIPRCPVLVVAARPTTNARLTALASTMSLHQGRVTPVLSADPRSRVQFIEVLQVLASMLLIKESR